MVPKRIDASAAAPWPGLSSSSESSSSLSLSLPQSSLSARVRMNGFGGSAGAADLASCVMRWKGLVDSADAAGWGGGGGGAAGDAAGESDGWVIILKYGLRLSEESVGGLTTGTAGTLGGVVLGSNSWLATVGVDA